MRDQKRREAQALAEALLDAETRIGELTAKIDPLAGRRNSIRDSGVADSKADQIARLGLQPKQVERFETLAAHPEVVAQVKADARENDDLPTRTEVLRRVAERYFPFARLPFNAPTTASPAAIRMKIAPTTG